MNMNSILEKLHITKPGGFGRGSLSNGGEIGTRDNINPYTSGPPLLKGSVNYSYTGDGIDYRQVSSAEDASRDWNPNITGHMGGDGLDVKYSNGNFIAGRGDLAGNYTNIGQAQLFGARAISTSDPDMLYNIIVEYTTQIISSSLLQTLLSILASVLIIVAIVYVFMLSFPQYVPMRQYLRDPRLVRFENYLSFPVLITLVVALTPFVSISFPTFANLLLMLFGIVLLMYVVIFWSTRKQWFYAAIGAIVLFAGLVREYVDFSANIMFSVIMAWMSILCLILVAIDAFYYNRGKSQRKLGDNF